MHVEYFAHRQLVKENCFKVSKITFTYDFINKVFDMSILMVF